MRLRPLFAAVSSATLLLLSLVAAGIPVATAADTTSRVQNETHQAEGVDGSASKRRKTRLRRLASKSKGGSSSYGSYGTYGGGGGSGGGKKYYKKPPKDYHYYKPCKEMKKTHRKSRYDIGIRFNKFEMTNDYYGPPVYLDWKDYPLKDDMVHTLKHYSTIESLVMPDDYEVHGACVEDYIKKIGGYPTYPSKNPRSSYWKELEEVVVAQELRKAGQIPDFFYLPKTWQHYTAYEVAEAVHDEYPGSNQVELLKYLLAQGLKIDHKCIPYRSRYDFIGEEVRLATLNTWSIGLVAPINFMIKHRVGRPRPEEVVWSIYNGHLTAKDGVPSDLVSRIRSLRLAGPTSFTAYMEGSPTHPAWPAMHSAASSASLWLAVVADLTAEQYCEALRTDFAVAYARTVAGVHYPSDNIAGLNLGQEIVAEHLAEHLAWTYGGDPHCFQEKIDALRFDWHSFDPVTCTVKHLNYYQQDDDHYW